MKRYQHEGIPRAIQDVAVDGYKDVFETPLNTFYGVRSDGTHTAFYAHPAGAFRALTRPNDLARRIIASGPRLG